MEGVALKEQVRHDKALVPPTWAVNVLRWDDEGRRLYAPPWRLDTATAMWERDDPSPPPRLPDRSEGGLPSGFSGLRALAIPGGERWLVVSTYRPARRGVEQRPAPEGRTVELLVLDGSTRPPETRELWFGDTAPPERLAATSQWLAANVDGVTLWNASSLDRVRTLSVGTVGALAISPDGAWIAASELTRVSVWSTSDGTLTHQLEPHPAPVSALAFHPTAPLLAVGSRAGGGVDLWSLDDGQRRSALALGAVDALAFDGSGERLAAAVSGGAGAIVELAVQLPGPDAEDTPSDPATDEEPDAAPVAAASEGLLQRIWRWLLERLGRSR